MKCSHPSKSRLPAALSVAVTAVAIYIVSTLFVTGAEPKSTDSTAPAAAKEAAPKKAAKEKTPAKKLTGAELYQINCNRCHPERYPTEFTSTQWKTLMTHMRVRANLPAAQAREILKYLQEDSGN